MLVRILSLLVSLAMLEVAPVCAAEVRISAAASLSDALNEICETYRASHPDVALVRNFAASGTLAKQIDSGAPADLFISANPEWLDYLEQRQRIPRDEAWTLAGNALVVVGARGAPVASLDDLERLGRIAIGSPKSVPAGQYAEQALRAVGHYQALVEGRRLILAKDVRQALMYADRGEVDAAFVYRTDALLAQAAVVLFEIPQALYPQIAYPAALTAEGVNNPAARAFAGFLKSSAAAKILEKYGFSVKE